MIRTLDSEVERSTFKSGEFSFVKSVVDLNLAVLMNFGFRDISLSNSSVSESSRFDADLGLGLSDMQNISKVNYFQSPFIFAKYLFKIQFLIKISSFQTNFPQIIEKFLKFYKRLQRA